MAMPSRDDQLLDAFMGDRSEPNFLALYDRHAAAMYVLAYRLMGAREADAADALQEAWLRAIPGWRASAANRRSAPGCAASSSTAAGSVFAGRCSRSSMMSSPCPPFAVASSVPSKRSTSRGRSHLYPLARTVVILHDIEGHTHDEIAGALGIDPGTSKSQLSRGRAALRRRLDPRPGHLRQS